MKLMQNSGVPIYQQIADSFKTDILAGRYEQGVPSVYKRAGKGLENQCDNHDEGL
mgnify:CR=1 FL=1